MHWKKKCFRCLLSKKEHKKPYPTWWTWANIRPHSFIKPTSPPSKVHFVAPWNGRIPLCMLETTFGYSYTPDEDPNRVSCKKCIRYYLEGTSAKIEDDARRARIQKRQEKAERIRRKREASRKSKTSRKAGKKLRKREEREVRLHRRKSKRSRSD